MLDNSNSSKFPILGYYCRTCRSVFGVDYDLEINEDGYKICPICDNLLEECDGTT